VAVESGRGLSGGEGILFYPPINRDCDREKMRIRSAADWSSHRVLPGAGGR
jgi:hypothetical protein